MEGQTLNTYGHDFFVFFCVQCMFPESTEPPFDKMSRCVTPGFLAEFELRQPEKPWESMRSAKTGRVGASEIENPPHCHAFRDIFSYPIVCFPQATNHPRLVLYGIVGLLDCVSIFIS